MTNSEFLNWMADRLVNVYKENENTDFVLKLRDLAEKQEDTRFPMNVYLPNEASFLDFIAGNLGELVQKRGIRIDKSGR